MDDAGQSCHERHGVPAVLAPRALAAKALRFLRKIERENWIREGA